ncbi:flagellar basal body rod modification protein [Alcanivorax balearicus MACL04]|uniref:Basal-body rod modification protein FlgD n=1 Tax=Alloalcanivorax balearicus MACL04 TaxID=1177182 RepID=A0ABT2R378_9GAMM|nr:flagellar hook assembly protein FlgD [Alloalcanivorax balearicus]MCU5784226.1 flagellar basal body rod modification protein [Alloalcanivorax balearicus MACL04]
MAAATQNISNSVLNSMNSTSSGDSRGAAGELQDSFMTLLVTQLKNQDPMNPMENAELTSQLAQINTVSGIQELNARLGEINDQIDAGKALQATALIGRGVLVAGDRVLVGEEGATTPFGVELDKAADNVVVTITDGSGQVVRRFELGALDAGVESFVWDGKLEDETLAPEGAYKVSVTATSNDTPMDVTTLNYALVNGVKMGTDGLPRLDLGGISDPVTLDEVRQIL